MKKYMQINKYEQTLEYERVEGVLRPVNITCTCKHGSLFMDNWRDGLNVCWHITAAVGQLHKKAGIK